MKKIHLSRHAKNRMRKFKISSEIITQTLREPILIEPSIKGRNNAWKKLQGRYYRVTFFEESNKIVIVTVTPKEKLPGRLKNEN